MFPFLMGLVAAIFIAYNEYTGAGISALLGILMLFSYQGIIVDRETMRYLKYDRFLRFRIGRWEPLSPPSYVTVVRINLSSMRNLPSPLVLPDNSKNAKSYKVNLVVEGAERYVNICRGPLDEMVSEALRLGKILEVRVLDFTTHEKKWIL
ncbi:MAG: hypothetical protein EHM46_03370 [Bacteroidetes bacterium]|nr:MAG: hypothetical protein EHM46_03370 [Bacteroidota bacterium]